MTPQLKRRLCPLALSRRTSPPPIEYKVQTHLPPIDPPHSPTISLTSGSAARILITTTITTTTPTSSTHTLNRTMSTPFSIHGAPTTPLDFNFRSTTPMSKRTEPSPGPCKYDDLHTFYPRDPGQGLLRSTSFTPTDTINLNAAVAYREYIARTPSVQSFAATTPKASRSFNANANTNLTRRPGHLPPVCEEGSRFDYPAQDDYDSGSGSTAQYPPLGQFGHGSSYHGKVSAWIENLNQVIDESSNVHVPLWTPHMRDTIVKDKDGKFAQGIKIISNLLFAPSGNARVGTSRTEVDMEFDRQAREEYKKRMAQNQHLAGYVGESG